MGKAYSSQILVAASTSLNSAWFECTGLGQLSLSVRLSPSAATLQGTLTIRGTNTVPQDTTPPALVNGTLLSPADAAMGHAAGVITFNNPSVAIHEITLTFPQFPQFIRADYVFTSGGGTVSLIVTASGWAVG